jgi:Serine dehydrogenase proteinase
MNDITQLAERGGGKARRNGEKRRAPKARDEPAVELNLDEGGEPDAIQIANEIAQSLGCEVVLYNGPISEDGFGKIAEVFPSMDQKGCVLILVTYGGDASAAYRIARFMQDVFKPFIVFVPGPCKSAGTLLATGAHQLIMLPSLGELGPLDVQLYKRDELGETRSGLVTRSAIQSLGEHAFELYSMFMMEIKNRSGNLIRFTTATEVASLMASTLVSEIYRKIDPDNLGDEHRDTQIAFHYACRLARKGRNIDDRSIEHLVYDYPSHDFLIDLDEASGIFKMVEAAPRPLLRLVAALGADLMASVRTVTVKRLSVPTSEVATDTGGSDGREPEGQEHEKVAAD